MTKVVLLQNIKGYGLIGDVKNAADGYAKNYLLPNKIAKLLTAGTLKEIEILKKKASIMVEVEKKNAEAVAKQLSEIVIKISRKASDHDTLFDGIDGADISSEIKAMTRIEVSEDMIKLEDKIKKVGNYDIEIELMHSIKTVVKLEVVKE